MAAVTWGSIMTEHRQLIVAWLEAHGFTPDMVSAQGVRRDNLQRRMDLAVRSVASKVMDLVQRYGETGFGNKPENLTTLEYWLAHIDYGVVCCDRFNCVYHRVFVNE